MGASLHLSSATRSVVQVEPQLAAKCMRIYGNAHAYHINSISPNSDGETFISADDLRVNLWHYEYTDKSFNVVDIKPDNMEDLTEVITAADFHPVNCNHLVYSSSKGCIRLADLRDAALCDRRAKDFQKEDGGQASRSFFSEIISSVSDVKFSRCGRYLVSRDYMTVKLWDVNKENAPVATFKVHEPLRAKLCDLYENDCIFDKFEVTMSGDARHLATGSYGSFFRVFGTSNSQVGAVSFCSRSLYTVACRPASAPLLCSSLPPFSSPHPPTFLHIDDAPISNGSRVRESFGDPFASALLVAARRGLCYPCVTRPHCVIRLRLILVA